MKDVQLAFPNRVPYEVLVKQEVLSTILSESTKSRDGNETGGILIGVDSNNHVEFLRAGGPGPGAIRRPDLFCRDTVFSQEIVDDEWSSTGSDWIGEWHTHTVGSPIPSQRDRLLYRHFVNDEDLFFARFFSLIVCSTDESWRSLILKMWLVTPQNMSTCWMNIV